MRRVAITGFGVVSPVGTGKAGFWASLKDGVSGIGRITRFDAETFSVRLAGEVKDSPHLPPDVDAFARRDPKVGFAFAAFAEAVGQAGISRLDSRTLLHIGTSLETYDLRLVVRDGRADFGAAAGFDPGTEDGPVQIPLDKAARLIEGRYGRPGRSLTNCSACAAGAQAIGHGFQAVRSGLFETAVCGGFDSMINPLGVGGFQLLGALSVEEGHGPLSCRPFDAGRTGAVLGEGAAVFVLEPLEKALAEGKDILAEVVGYGSSLDAYSLSAPDPDGSGAERAMRAALADAGLSPADISHINTHGTGTQLNDEVEATAIRRVFDGHWERIPVAATKSVTGHLIAASGAVETGACLLPLLFGHLPPNPALERVARGCELHHVTESDRMFNGRYALTNSFGFGGQNAALVLGRVD
ncbi:MAG: beta-ketoacyl-[acyl-carrier-protein] synthase family protein [Nitrospirae bacterium]|nr:beta-ketoacyl-[acyl-carrier-protein] synthase family protein [Nitrospirota bacterium]MBI5696151.1 beta-ketoacyl-[acyl-carrier-protein] synthase family protein [Nitrospirota bacterium]